MSSPSTAASDPFAKEREQLTAKIAEQEQMLERYRRFVGKLATHKSKDSAWYTAKAWADRDFWWSIGRDLKEEEEQKAFLFS